MFPSWCYNHLMVYLRLGWLTVLSSRKMVEQELYLRLKVPCYKYTNTHTNKRLLLEFTCFGVIYSMQG